MLTLHSCNPARGKCDTDLTADSLPEDVNWIDLFEPTPDEIAFAERVTKLRVPSRGEIAEIEASSRLRTEDGTLYLSAPALYRTDRQSPRTTSVGFVLSAGSAGPCGIKRAR
jgi:magnesium transporter